MMPIDLAASGARAGRGAAKLFMERADQGTHGEIRLALPERVKAAKLEAQQLLHSGSAADQEAAEFWLAFYSELESGMAGAKQ